MKKNWNLNNMPEEVYQKEEEKFQKGIENFWNENPELKKKVEEAHKKGKAWAEDLRDAFYALKPSLIQDKSIDPLFEDNIFLGQGFRHFFMRKYGHYTLGQIMQVTGEKGMKMISDTLNEYVVFQTDKIRDPQPESTIRDVVYNSFKFMLKNDPRKHRQIIAEADLNKLVVWFTKYLENKFEIPEIESPIREINTTIGNVVQTFKYAYWKVHPTTSTYPSTLFELMAKCFYNYQGHTIEQLLHSNPSKDYKQFSNNYK